MITGELHRQSMISATAVHLASSRIPRLLVSVRNAAEATHAIRGGCQILDVKEPRHGSLGMASEVTLQEIAQHVKRESPEIILTAALGEVHEHKSDLTRHLPQELNLVKLGCAQLGKDPNWQQTWRIVRDAYSRFLAPATGWVAVVYADWQLAEAPSPKDIIAEALTSGCRGVLFDTYTKSGRRLLDWISVPELVDVAGRLHAAGMFLALAGSLRREDLPQLRKVSADIIAIRGAACADRQRTAAIQEAAVHDFQAAIQQSWNSA